MAKRKIVGFDRTVKRGNRCKKNEHGPFHITFFVAADGSEHRKCRCIKCGYFATGFISKKEAERICASGDATVDKISAAMGRKYGDSFYTTPEWLKLRYKAFLIYGRRCALCGSRERLHVDHIKPRSMYPSLALSLDNLQVLCHDCNMGKSNTDETDWRTKSY